MRTSNAGWLLQVIVASLSWATVQACSGGGSGGSPGSDASTSDGHATTEAGQADSGGAKDGAAASDAGDATTAESGADAEAGSVTDGPSTDGNSPGDGATSGDGSSGDGGAATDAADASDTGTAADTGSATDAGDAGDAADTGTTTGPITFTVVVGQSGVLNHWPGPDGLIGTIDDVVSASNSSLNGSDPNSIASYSFNAFDFGTHQTDPDLPSQMNAATFLQGTVVADPQIATAGGGSLLTGWTLSGTQPFQGHGAYSTTITKVNSGTFNASTHALTINFDMSVTLIAGTATASGIALTGTGYLVKSAAFGTATGNTYVDTKLIPLAQSLSAKALLFAQASGTVPASSGGTGGSFPGFPIDAVLVGIQP